HRLGAWHVGDEVADLLDVADDRHAVKLPQHLLGHRAAGDADVGLAGAAAPAAPVVAQAVLGVEGVVGVAGAVLVFDLGGVAAALVLVADEDRDGGAGRAPLENAREDLRL